MRPSCSPTRPRWPPSARVGVRSIDLGQKLSATSYRSLAARSPALLTRLHQDLEREWPYDVLIVHFKKEQLLSSLLPEKLRAKLLWAEWGPVPRQMVHGAGRWAYLAAARRADLILAVSAGTRDSICALGVPAKQVHVIPNALPVPESYFSAAGRVRVRRENGIPVDALVVGCVSRFHAKKRNDVAVDAVVGLGRDDVHLVMAGEGRGRTRPPPSRASRSASARISSPILDVTSRACARRSTSRSSVPARPRGRRSR